MNLNQLIEDEKQLRLELSKNQLAQREINKSNFLMSHGDYLFVEKNILS